MRNPRLSLITRRALPIAAALLALAPMAALAQNLRPLGNVNLQIIIGRVISGVLGILGSLALLMFIYGGFIWMTTAGNEEKIKKAKNTVVYAVLGLIICFASYGIVSFVLDSISEAKQGEMIFEEGIDLTNP